MFHNDATIGSERTAFLTSFDKSLGIVHRPIVGIVVIDQISQEKISGLSSAVSYILLKQSLALVQIAIP